MVIMACGVVHGARAPFPCSIRLRECAGTSPAKAVEETAVSSPALAGEVAAQTVRGAVGGGGPAPPLPSLEKLAVRTYGPPP